MITQIVHTLELPLKLSVIYEACPVTSFKTGTQRRRYEHIPKGPAPAESPPGLLRSRIIESISDLDKCGCIHQSERSKRRSANFCLSWILRM